jgi:hypothetical protein
MVHRRYVDDDSPDRCSAGCIEAFALLQFALTNARGIFAEHTHTYDFLLSTVSANISGADCLNMLEPNGSLCLVAVPANEARYGEARY